MRGLEVLSRKKRLVKRVLREPGELSHGKGRYTARTPDTSRDARSDCAAGITEIKGELLSIGGMPILHRWDTKQR
jgi:hypothetical protein